MLSSFLNGVTVSVGIRTTHLAFRHRSRRVDIDGRLGGYKLIWREGYGLDTPEDPGLVVLHGGRGITDQIQHQAQYLADQGYVTLIPDLYGGKIPPEIFDEQYLLWGFDREVAVRDLQASIAYLRLDNSSRKVGVVGFEMGGALSFLAASSKCPPQSTPNCAVSIGGIPSDSICEDLVQHGVPIQGHFPRVTQGRAAEALEGRLRTAGSMHEPFHYTEASEIPLIAQERGSPQVQQAWGSIFRFLGEHLK